MTTVAAPDDEAVWRPDDEKAPTAHVIDEDDLAGIVTIPTPLPNQKPVLDHTARFKIVRAGRRWSKTRMSFIAGIRGHGALPNGKGVIDGALIVWVAPSYKQADAIWLEEIVPRFAGKRNCRTLEAQKTLVVGTGRLIIRSAESIDTLRGLKPDGVIVDEGAFLDLEYALARVIRPALVDKRGWLIIVSTTSVGSYFNRLCGEVESGQRGDDWKSFRGRTRDNPRLPPDEIDAIYAEYPPNSTDLLQELEAELVEIHGTLFQRDYFKFYDSADRNAMYLAGLRHNFDQIVVYCDLASRLKQTSDFTAIMVAGLTRATPADPRKAGILEVINERLEGPMQIDLLAEIIDRWAPTLVGIESVSYQMTAIQHLKIRRPRANIVDIPVDKDKRSRAVPYAAAMSRGEVWWPEHAAYMPLVVGQHLKFPNGRDGSIHADEHDDIVDTGSMLATQLTRLASAGTAWQTLRVSTR